jgi:transglycosylase-like protein with SLT domain/sporulation related protein
MGHGYQIVRLDLPCKTYESATFMALKSNPSVLTYALSAILLSAVVPAIALDGTPPRIDNARTEGEALASPADETKPSAPKPEAHEDKATQETLCLMIESAAKANDLPLEFFIRLIWQESRFQPKAVGPVTRNGQRAEGIAQFMPGTASERQLLDPFDPVQALPKSAEFLSELRSQFGNLGLAAAAYNAGPRRVQEWLARTGEIPQETRNYVVTITGASVDDWALAKKNGKMFGPASNNNCLDLLATLKRSPNPFVIQLEDRVRRAAIKLWGVQIAAGFNRDNALAMYAKAMKGLSALIGKRDDPLLIRSHGSSTFYQVQIGTDTRREADDLCNNMRRAGGACLVKRNKVDGFRISRVKGHIVRRPRSD